MKEINTVLKKDGFDLKQIARQRNWAVYEQSKAGKVTSYELIQIKISKATEIYGRSYPDREVYPSNEDWGLLGFTISDKDEALKRLAALVKS